MSVGQQNITFPMVGGLVQGKNRLPNVKRALGM